MGFSGAQLGMNIKSAMSFGPQIHSDDGLVFSWKPFALIANLTNVDPVFQNPINTVLGKG